MRVLDLFAGMGSLGIEALSRGAEEATFVEQHPEGLSCIDANLRYLKLTDCSEVLATDVFKAIDELRKMGRKFDVIFVDPPYNKGLITKSLLAIDQSDILCAHGWVVLEHTRTEGLPELVTLVHTRTKQYGITSLTFLIRRD